MGLFEGRQKKIWHYKTNLTRRRKNLGTVTTSCVTIANFYLHRTRVSGIDSTDEMTDMTLNVLLLRRKIHSFLVSDGRFFFFAL